MSPPRRSVTALVGLCVGALLVAGGCGGGPSPEDFREADSTGYRACANFDRSIGAGGDYRRDALDLAAIGGLRAKTAAIRNAVDDRNGGQDGAPLIRDHDAFKDACSDAGYRF